MRDDNFHAFAALRDDYRAHFQIDPLTAELAALLAEAEAALAEMEADADPIEK